MLLLSAVSSTQLGKITTYPFVQFSESRSNAISNRRMMQSKEFFYRDLAASYVISSCMEDGLAAILGGQIGLPIKYWVSFSRK